MTTGTWSQVGTYCSLSAYPLKPSRLGDQVQRSPASWQCMQRATVYARCLEDDERLRVWPAEASALATGEFSFCCQIKKCVCPMCVNCDCCALISSQNVCYILRLAVEPVHRRHSEGDHGLQGNSDRVPPEDNGSLKNRRDSRVPVSLFFPVVHR